MPLHFREDFTARRVDLGAAGGAVPYCRCACGAWSSTDPDPAVRGCGYLSHIATVCTDAEIAGIMARARWDADRVAASAPAWDDLDPAVWPPLVRNAMPWAVSLRVLLTGG